MQSASRNASLSDAKSIGEKIILKRLKMGMSQKDLSVLSGVHQAQLSEVERNKPRVKNFKKLDLIALALNVSENWLIGVTNNESRSHELDEEEAKRKEELLELPKKLPAAKVAPVANNKLNPGDYYTLQIPGNAPHDFEGCIFKFMAEDDFYIVWSIVHSNIKKDVPKRVLLQKGRNRFHQLSKKLVKCLELEEA